MNYGTDGMWHLRGRFDFLTGRRINQALAAAIRARKQHEASADHTHPQHAADALAALVCGEDRADTQLLILADYDHTTDTLGNPRLDDGTPLSRGTVGPRSPRRGGLLRRLQRRLDQPRPRTHPQRLRRATPHPRRQRPRLHPLRHPHRTHPRPPQNPHAAGGPTTITNLELLCAPCHTHHHRTDNHHHDTQPPARPPDTPTPTRRPTAENSTDTPTTRGP